MVEYEVVPATLEHAAYVAEHMRAPDVAEVWTSGRLSPLDGINKSVRVSRDTAFAALADGVPFAVFGVMPFSTLSDGGAPWLLGTDELPKHARAFLRGSRGFIRAMLNRYRVLTNYADARNTEAIKWLRWLGFELGPAEPFGADGLPFHRFVSRS